MTTTYTMPTEVKQLLDMRFFDAEYDRDFALLQCGKSIQECVAIYAAIPSYYDDNGDMMDKETVKKVGHYFAKYRYELNAALAQDRLDNLHITASKQLMYCPKKYVVVNSDLLSPAGFHPSDRVFEQTKIAIHTDSLKNIPKSNFPLYAHDLSKLN